MRTRGKIAFVCTNSADLRRLLKFVIWLFWNFVWLKQTLKRLYLFAKVYFRIKLPLCSARSSYISSRRYFTNYVFLSNTSRIKEDVGIDSLDYVDIVAFISRNFRFKANLSAIKDIITLDELYEFICKNHEN